jgi:hypothetical protein
MKKIILIVIVLFIASISYSQNNTIETNKQYYFITTLSSADSAGKFSAGSLTCSILKNHIVQVVKNDGTTVTFKYLTFNKDTNLKTLYNGNSGDKEFEMSIENFNFYTKPYFNRWRGWKVGGYTIPVRLRSKDDNFEFESNLSLGANLIKGINFSRYGDLGHIDLSIGFSLTKVNLNADNSNLKLVSPELETLSPGALTFSIGATVELVKNVNFGVFTGWDFIDGAEQKRLRWIHNKKPWIGIGINITFNDNQSANTSSKNTQ